MSKNSVDPKLHELMVERAKEDGINLGKVQGRREAVNWLLSDQVNMQIQDARKAVYACLERGDIDSKDALVLMTAINQHQDELVKELMQHDSHSLS